MRDCDIRKALWVHLRAAHDGEDALILNELRLCQGAARVDIAVVNGSLNGFEIKSERDTLRRLPGQIESYSLVFDFLTMVVGPRYAENVRSHVPNWVGVMTAVCDAAGTISFTMVAEPQRNPHATAADQSKLLWRDEALAMLTTRGLDRGFRTASRTKLWGALAQLVPADDLRQAVRDTLKARGDWRVDPQRALSGAKSLLSPTS